MVKRLSLLSFFFSVILFFSGCIKSEYTKLIERELARGQRQDSILLGISFGDTRIFYFDRCMKLNKEQLVVQGSSGTYVRFLPMDSVLWGLGRGIKMEFEAGFDAQERINEVKIQFSYLGWAPWNKHLQSDVLKPYVITQLEKWYNGNDFIGIVSNNDSLSVKVDGNRRVIVGLKDDQTVLVSIQDILHPRFKH